MTTSGVVSFNPTVAQILLEAARKVNAIGRTGSLTGPMQQEWLFELNAMVKRWQALPGYHCWTTVEGTLFPKIGQYQYRAGPNATDHITHTYFQTKIASDEVLGQTLLGVEATTEVNVDDFCGVVLDDGSLFWSQVASMTSSSITIDQALPDSAAAGNPVFTYTTKIARPLKVLDARRYDISSGNETPVMLEARKDFRALPRKADSGSIVTLFYDKLIPHGLFNLWRVPSATTELINFTWNRPLEDYVSAANTSDFPSEWIQPIIWNLAALKIPQYPVAEADARRIETNAAQFLADVIGSDREDESVFVQPDMG